MSEIQIMLSRYQRTAAAISATSRKFYPLDLVRFQRASNQRWVKNSYVKFMTDQSTLFESQVSTIERKCMPNMIRMLKEQKRIIERNYSLRAWIEESKHLKFFISNGLKTRFVTVSKTSRSREAQEKTIADIRRVLRLCFLVDTRQSDFYVSYALLSSQS